jgi:hypothetical protein
VAHDEVLNNSDFVAPGLARRREHSCHPLPPVGG